MGEVKDLKVAIPSTGENIDANISPVFGRAPCFIIAKIENGEIKEWKSIKNPAEFQRGGAGICAARIVVDEGAEAVVTITIGPRAFDALKLSGVKIYRGVEDSIRKNLELLAKNELREIEAPLPGGMGRRGRCFRERW